MMQVIRNNRMHRAHLDAGLLGLEATAYGQDRVRKKEYLWNLKYINSPPKAIEVKGSYMKIKTPNDLA